MSLFSECFRDSLFIFGFQQFDNHIARNAFHIYLAWDLLNFLNLYFCLLLSLGNLVITFSLFFPETLNYSYVRPFDIVQ